MLYKTIFPLRIMNFHLFICCCIHYLSSHRMGWQIQSFDKLDLFSHNNNILNYVGTGARIHFLGCWSSSSVVSSDCCWGASGPSNVQILSHWRLRPCYNSWDDTRHFPGMIEKGWSLIMVSHLPFLILSL